MSYHRTAFRVGGAQPFTQPPCILKSRLPYVTPRPLFIKPSWILKHLNTFILNMLHTEPLAPGFRQYNKCTGNIGLFGQTRALCYTMFFAEIRCAFTACCQCDTHVWIFCETRAVDFLRDTSRVVHYKALVLKCMVFLAQWKKKSEDGFFLRNIRFILQGSFRKFIAWFPPLALVCSRLLHQ